MLVIATVGVNAFAFADGSSRPSTEAEKQYYARVINTVAKAIPAGPRGWGLVGQTEIEELTIVSTTVDNGQPLEVDYMISWKDAERIRKAEDATVQKLISSGTTQEQEITNIIKQNYPHDVAMDIDVRVNGNVYIPPEAVAAEPYAGAQVLRTEGEFSNSRYWQEGYTIVFLGSFWKDGVSQYIGETAELPHDQSPMKIQSIVINIQADPERTRKVLQQINWAALKRLLND
jgi:hypothetical protein